MAHRMRAFLLAMAMQAFCQPTRATSCTSQREIGSSRHQAEPGAELMAALELMEVADAGGERRGAELADADDLGSALRRRARSHVLADLGVAPAVEVS